jgi:DNA-binding MurR/RpiR family transcriptional regulator
MPIGNDQGRFANMTAPSLLSRIRDRLHELSPTERRLADFVLDFPGELASFSASELATLANVSNATVSRFIRRLGYDNFDEARRHARAEKGSGSPLFLVTTKPAAGAGLVAAHERQSHANLAATCNRLSDALLTEIAEAILAARKVRLVGYRNGYFLASYLRWQLIQVREFTSVIPGAGETLGEYLAGISHLDCVIIFGLRRRVPQLARVVAHAAKVGAKTLYITDQASAPDPGPVSWLCRCDTQAPGPLDNHVGVLALCHLIAARVLELAGPAGRRRLTAIEAAHEALEEL